MKRFLAWITALTLLAGCASPGQPVAQQSSTTEQDAAQTQKVQPADSLQTGSVAGGRTAAVSSANPAASRIGAEIL